MNHSETVIDRSDAQKAALINARRQELKSLGYAVVDSKWLKGLMIQAKRLEK